jgi:uncharacterized membrane protein HdeD (DUF308 family)
MTETDADDAGYVNGEYESNPAGRGKLISALIVLAGIWLVIEPLLFDLVPGNFWNDMILGFALIILGGYNYYRRANDQLASTAVAGLVVLIGVWLIASPFVYDTGLAQETIGFDEELTELGFWNDIVVGLLVLLSGIYSMVEARDVEKPRAVRRGS